MAEPETIKDPASAIVLARVEGRMEGLKQASDVQGRQLDGIQQDMRQVAMTSQRYITHDESVKQIWKVLAERDKKWDERFGLLVETHGVTREKINKLFWFSSGVSSVAVLLLSLVLWILGGEIKQSDMQKDKIHAIELHLAADQIRPYRAR